MNDSVRPVRQIVIEEDHDSVIAAMMGMLKEDYVAWLAASIEDSKKKDSGVVKGRDE